MDWRGMPKQEDTAGGVGGSGSGSGGGIDLHVYDDVRRRLVELQAAVEANVGLQSQRRGGRSPSSPPARIQQQQQQQQRQPSQRQHSHQRTSSPSKPAQASVTTVVEVDGEVKHRSTYTGDQVEQDVYFEPYGRVEYRSSPPPPPPPPAATAAATAQPPPSFVAESPPPPPPLVAAGGGGSGAAGGSLIEEVARLRERQANQSQALWRRVDTISDRVERLEARCADGFEKVADRMRRLEDLVGRLLEAQSPPPPPPPQPQQQPPTPLPAAGLLASVASTTASGGGGGGGGGFDREDARSSGVDAQGTELLRDVRMLASAVRAAAPLRAPAFLASAKESLHEVQRLVQAAQGFPVGPERGPAYTLARQYVERVRSMIDTSEDGEGE